MTAATAIVLLIVSVSFVLSVVVGLFLLDEEIYK